MTSTGRVIPAPQVTEEFASFWLAANHQRLQLRRCRETARAYYPPRERSPFTGSLDTELFDASGFGTLYSFSVLLRTAEPYCLAYVTLDEGPIVLTNIHAPDFSALRIGQRVRVVFVDSESGQKVPMFAPLEP